MVQNTEIMPTLYQYGITSAWVKVFKVLHISKMLAMLCIHIVFCI